MRVRSLKPFFDGVCRRKAGHVFVLPEGAKTCPKWCEIVEDRPAKADPQPAKR